MKKSKFLYIFVAIFILTSFVLFNYVRADSKNSEDNNGNSQNSQQVKDTSQRKIPLSISISNTGKVNVQGAKVTSISGSTINASLTWGSVVLSFGVNFTPSTNNIGGESEGGSSTSQISVGDIIGFQGNLITTSVSPILITATTIKDSSVQKKNASFNGFVKSVDTANNKFILTTTQNGDITVIISDSTKFEKGDMSGVFTDIAATSRVLVKGAYDSQLMQLQADDVKVYVPKTMATSVDGIIKALPGTTAPTTMVITSGDTNYTVNIATDTSVLNSSWLRTALNSLKVGDKVKIYGVINLNASIDATIIKDNLLS